MFENLTNPDDKYTIAMLNKYLKKLGATGENSIYRFINNFLEYMEAEYNRSRKNHIINLFYENHQGQFMIKRSTALDFLIFILSKINTQNRMSDFVCKGWINKPKNNFKDNFENNLKNVYGMLYDQESSVEKRFEELVKSEYNGFSRCVHMLELYVEFMLANLDKENIRYEVTDFYNNTFEGIIEVINKYRNSGLCKTPQNNTICVISFSDIDILGVLSTSKIYNKNFICKLFNDLYNEYNLMKNGDYDNITLVTLIEKAYSKLYNIQNLLKEKDVLRETGETNDNYHTTNETINKIVADNLPTDVRKEYLDYLECLAKIGEEMQRISVLKELVSFELKLDNLGFIQ